MVVGATIVHPTQAPVIYGIINFSRIQMLIELAFRWGGSTPLPSRFHSGEAF